MPKIRSVFFLALILTMLAATISGCSSGDAHAGGEAYAMAAMDGMPSSVKDSPVLVRQSYQFAAANPEILQNIPCYCGCGSMGHTSNYACYVSGEDASGALIYDEHALACSICVDITQDAMRLMRDGKALPEIRSYIDATYAKYGPSNIP